MTRETAGRARASPPGSSPDDAVVIEARRKNPLPQGERVWIRPMTRERISLYDTTLRDGAQNHGVDFRVEDKLLSAQQLDMLGLDYIEAGYPGANPTDTRLFAEAKPLGHARLTAFGMTKRPGRSLSNDPGFQALLATKVDAICLVAKTWDFHVDV